MPRPRDDDADHIRRQIDGHLTSRRKRASAEVTADIRRQLANHPEDELRESAQRAEQFNAVAGEQAIKGVAAAYIGDQIVAGFVETRCSVCGMTGQVPEDVVPPELTERPVSGLCPACQKNLLG